MNAPDRATEIKAVITAALAAVVGLLGWLGVAIVIFFAAMALDYITGTWAAKARGEWSSSVARAGLWHKLGEIAALLVAALCDIAVKVMLSTAAAPLLADFDYPGVATLIVAVWYIFTELGSILENAAKLGAPVPRWLIEGVGKLKGKVSQDGGMPNDSEK